MKTLNFEQMEKIEGGKLESCMRSLFWGAWVGGVIGNGPGALVGAALVAVGPNCTGWWSGRW